MNNGRQVKRAIRQFNGGPYSIWKFRIKAIIAEEGALQVLNEEPPVELTDNWKKMEMFAKVCIIEYISDSMIGTITEQDTARDVFKKFDDIIERKSLAIQLAV